MTEEEQRQIQSRINRLEGQVRSLGRLLTQEQVENFIIQNQAIIAAARSILTVYVENNLLNKKSLTPAEQKQLLRLIRKND